MTFRGAQLKRTSDSTPTRLAAVTWDAAEFDSDSFWSAGASERLTIPAGITKVRLRGQLHSFSSPSVAGSMLLAIRKNAGFDYVGIGFASQRHASDGVGASVQEFVQTSTLAVTAGDYFDLFFNQSPTTWMGQASQLRSWLELQVAESWRGAVVNISADKTIANDTPVIWDAAALDTDAIWSAGQPSRLTVPAGVSRIRLWGQFAKTSRGTALSQWSRLYKNGVAQDEVNFGFRLRQGTTGFPDNFNTFASQILTVTPGDYFEIASNTTDALSNQLLAARSWFEMEIVE